MSDQRSSGEKYKKTSTGHALSESSYLNTHFEAMRPEYEAMVRSVGFQPGWKVLDAGCGSGSFLELLAELVTPDGHISAIDLAPENIQVVDTQVKSGRFDCPVETRVGQITDLPYEDDSFDAVWCANVTQYLTNEELRKMLDEFRRVTRPGGIVAVKDFDLTLQQFIPGDPVNNWILLKELRPINGQIRGTFRVLELPIWFSQAGLKEIRYKTAICERQAPLRSVEQMFIGDVFRFTARMAENINLPEPVLLAWKKLGDTESPNHPMKQPDFYYREGSVVVTARVPAS